MIFKFCKHICLFMLIFSTIGSYGQSRKELKEQISHKKQEINNASKILEETRANKKSSINELYILKKRIQLRNELIEHLNNQIHNLDGKIRSNTNEIEKLKVQLQKMKKNYERIIYHAYINNKGFSKLMFVLASESFNQAYKRFKYLNQYAKYRKNQARQIQLQKEKLELKLQELRNLKNQKEDILASKVQEKSRLKSEQYQVDRQIETFKKKEKELRQDIEEKRRIIAQLEDEIQKIIEEERKRTKLWKNLSEYQKQLSQGFEQSKGQLNWPISQGIVTRKFGENEHPVLKGVKTYNNGIDISASRNSEVKCLYDGIARKVVAIPGANLTVIIRHGNYLTVYSNLVDVSVKPGDRISKGQVIGEVYNDQDNNENILHLEIYRENQKLNPEVWLN